MRPFAFLLVALLVLVTAAGCTSRSFAGSSGWSGIAVGSDVVYVGARTGRVLALDARTGSQRAAFPPEGQDPLKGLYGTPALVDGVLYVPGYDGRVYALNAADLSLRWQYPIDISTVKSIVGGVAVADNLVVFGSSDGYVRALNTSSGLREWEFKTDGVVWSTPTISGGVVYVGSLGKKLYALSLANGVPLWAQPFEAGGAIISSPLVAGSRVIFGSFDRQVYALDAGTGRQVWSFRGGSWFWHSPVTDAQRVFVATTKGVLHALTLSSGQEIWQFNLQAPVISSPVLMEDRRLAVTSDGGIVYLISTENGGQVSTYNIGAQVQAPLTTDGQTVYINAMNERAWAIRLVGRQEKLWCINTKDKQIC
ncbi:MAG: PQQ-binding-like beta-propeller repeat protein [Chloroflexi bacterium]|nr:PQQ-binding-like beta-propeller repeat protein [Chloroflexota bacterium]